MDSIKWNVIIKWLFKESLIDCKKDRYYIIFLLFLAAFWVLEPWATLVSENRNHIPYPFLSEQLVATPFVGLTPINIHRKLGLIKILRFCFIMETINLLLEVVTQTVLSKNCTSIFEIIQNKSFLHSKRF